MSGYKHNANTLYLRPMANIKEYQVFNAAKMLYRNRSFVRVSAAYSYLRQLELNKPWQFKAIMSNYFETVCNHTFRKTMDINNYTTGGPNLYGNEPHMY